MDTLKTNSGVLLSDTSLGLLRLHAGAVAAEGRLTESLSHSRLRASAAATGRDLKGA